MADAEAGTPEGAPAAAAPSMAERRHVSVLFVDLVGFTGLAEERDPEAVRELLSDYFDQARTLVGRYGGTIEKFIGDAVMAVWGTPSAREDDAERAVRAALDLLDAVAELGERAGVPGLAARAGVVSGEAAVRLDAVDQGMVAGDVVNTASRVQAAADPGQVLVDDATRTASAGAIDYAGAGEHVLKGKVEPVRLHAALEVVAGSGGAQRFDGLEPPFLGRERDLRMLKELLHDGVEQSRAQLVIVTGAAGLGKSRLGWELFKYIDGIEQPIHWHIGRCLAYGEGIAYWALAEMLRMRLRIGEDDVEAEVLRKLDVGLDELITDAEERDWLRPRLAVLLGSADEPTEGIDRDSLFAGWRLFLERLAARAPVVMVFEDMHDAEDGLLDFVDHLLQFSADLPLFLLVLARPELHDQRPSWGRQRNETVLHLDRLPDERIQDMVAAMVDGLPDASRKVLAARADGVPLFAIETIRMLIDRDVVVPRQGRYVLAADVGDLDDLDVPPTLQALVAARLDGLPDAERRLVRDASVLGQSFTRSALDAVVRAAGDVPLEAVDGLLAVLVEREILTMRADARSLDAGQYSFVQKLMRRVAEQRLSRDDRKVRHLAAAEHLRDTRDAGDIAGVIAAHYLAAAEARPQDDDAPELRATAIHHLERAGDRARALGAIEEALRHYERALELTEDDTDRARLSEAAGVTAQFAAKFERALGHLARARALLHERGDRSGVARVASWQAETLMDLDRVDDAFALAALLPTEGAPDVEDARLAAALAMLAVNYPDVSEPPGQWLELAARAAEAAGAWDVLGRVLSLKATQLLIEGRRVEAAALGNGAFDLARRHGLHFRAAVQAAQLLHGALEKDLGEAQAWLEACAAHARRSGDRHTLAQSQECRAILQFERGDWDQFDREGLRTVWADAIRDDAADQLPTVLVLFAVHLGDRSLLLEDVQVDEASRGLTPRDAPALLRRAIVAAVDGDHAASLRAATLTRGYTGWAGIAWSDHLVRAVLVDAALALGRLEIVREILGGSDVGALTTPLAAAHHAWGRARLAAAEGDDVVAEEAFQLGTTAFRDLERPFWLGRVLLDHAEWLLGRGEQPRARGLAAEAHDTFTRLGAVPLADRASLLEGQELTG